jgi:hypothetical protein
MPTAAGNIAVDLTDHRIPQIGLKTYSQVEET